MDMSLFKETLKRHSIRLKEDAIEAEVNDAIIAVPLLHRLRRLNP